jgi:hypothetical protein
MLSNLRYSNVWILILARLLIKKPEMDNRDISQCKVGLKLIRECVKEPTSWWERLVHGTLMQLIKRELLDLYLLESCSYAENVE